MCCTYLFIMKFTETNISRGNRELQMNCVDYYKLYVENGLDKLKNGTNPFFE